MAKLGKRISYAVLSVVAILCFAFAIIPAIKKPISVSAQNVELPETSTIMVVDGASIRLDDYAGLRFSASVSEEYFNQCGGTSSTWGFLVALGDTGAAIAGEDFVYGTEGIAAVSISSWVSDSWSNAVKIKNAGLKQYNLVLTDMPVEAFQTDVYVRAFVKIGEEFEYSDNVVARNIHTIAKQAINDTSLIFNQTEYDNLTYYVNQCTQDALHSWNEGTFVEGAGWVNTCTVCGTEHISDPIKVWGDGDGVILDRNGIELHQSADRKSVV